MRKIFINRKGNSPTPQQITRFVPLFVQAYDAYRESLEKTRKDKNNHKTFLAPKTVDDPIEDKNRLPPLQNEALLFAVLAVPKMNL